MRPKEYLIFFRGIDDPSEPRWIAADSKEKALEGFIQRHIVIREPEEVHRVYQCMGCEKQCTVTTCGWPEFCLHSYPDKVKWELRRGWGWGEAP